MNGWLPLLQYQQALTLWQWAIVVVTISIGIWMIARLRSHFREDADDEDGALEMLSQFSELHQEGGLSDDEFRLIKNRLSRAAYDALVAERRQKIKSSVVSGPTGPVEASNEEAAEEPRQTAITEKEEKSEGRSDDES